MAPSSTPQPPPVVNDLTTSELQSALSQAASSSPLRTNSSPTTLDDTSFPTDLTLENPLPRPDNPTPFGQSYLLDTFSPAHIGFGGGRSINSLMPPRIARSSSASSVELIVPGSGRSPLMGQVFDPHIFEAFSSALNTPAEDMAPHTFHRTAPSPNIPHPAPHRAPSAHHHRTPRKLKSLRPLIIKQLPESPSITASSPIVPPSVPALPSLPHNPTYYLRDEMVIFEVEGSLYRVHRYHLERNSEFFRRLFLSDQGQPGSFGKTDGTAIPLPDITQRAFDSLLHFLYHGIYEPDTVSLNEWVSLLSVSTQLRFIKIRKWAIREISAQLSNMDAVVMIVLAMKYDVPEWLAPAYTMLCRRSYPLNDVEAEQLGSRITARIGRAREVVREEAFRAFQRRRYGMRFAMDPYEIEEQLIARVVQQVFWPEGVPHLK